MFSFLSPVSLWLGALVAIPLAIHFLGRQRLRKEPFPSLMLLEEKFSRSMQRHRLKNLLLLLLRTLLILCLFLALSNPALEMQAAGPAPAGGVTAAALLHNGAFGMLPVTREAGPAPGSSAPDARAAGSGRTADALEIQRRRIRALDSALGTPVRVTPLIADGPGASEASARHGNYGEAVERLLATLDAQAPAAQVYLPVFAWEDLEPAAGVLAQALRERPGLQLVLWDHGAEGARLTAFSGVRAVPSPRSPTVALRALPGPAADGLDAPKVRAWLGGRILQEEEVEDGAPVEIALPLSEGPRTAGRLSLEGAGAVAYRDWHFSFPNPGRLVLAHAGSALASLPSLGRENYFRRIVHVPAAKDIPWEAAPRLVYLSNERNTDAAAYSRLVEFVRNGGRLIVGVGRESDLPLLNRFLLQPLRMGRLGSLAEAPQGPRAEAVAEAMAGLGGLPSDPGPLGAVRKRFAFAPDSGTSVLIRQGGEPVLALRDFHRGKVLLWTTDLDDLDWTDLGVAPLIPLLHQAFQESAGGLTSNRAVAADSTLVLDVPASGAAPVATGPEGRPFTRLRADGSRVRLGPFDKAGLHRVSWGRDTVVFAVNVEPRGPSQARDLEEWDGWNRDGREEFLKGFEEFRGRVTVASPEMEEGVRAAVRPLWKAFFLAAILLLFLEGLVASAFSPGSVSRGRDRS
jgi:hypothetical protein